MSGFGNFLTKSLKEAAEDLVKSKFSNNKREDSNNSNNMNQQYPSSQPGNSSYGNYQGGPSYGGGNQLPYPDSYGQPSYPQQPNYGGGYGGQQQSGAPPGYGLNIQPTGGYGPGGQIPQNYGGNPQYGQKFGGPGGYNGQGSGYSYGGHDSTPHYGGAMNMPGGNYGQGYAPSQYFGQMPPQSGIKASNYAYNSPMTVPMSLGNPSIRVYSNFNPSIDAEALRKAMKGIGCNNTRVIDILCKRTNLQRIQIARTFQQMYGKDLIKELKSELYGDFEDVIIALMIPSPEYDASELRRAIEGIGTNENILIEIMCSRTNAQIRDIKLAYKYLYNIDLESDVRGDTSGYFKRLLVALSTGFRDESNFTDMASAQQSAKSLYSAGEGRLGTDEAAFLGVLCSQNFAQLNLVFQEYHKLTGRTLDVAIKNEFSGDIMDGLLALYHIVVNRPGYFASQLERSMKGFGTRDKDLIRLIVSRCEVDMVDIRNEFQKMYGRSLEQTISGDTSGSYKNALITLVRGN